MRGSDPRRKHWTVALGALAAVLVLGPAAAPASATNWAGATGQVSCPVNMADNADHFFYYDNVSTDLRTATDATRANPYNPTDVNTINESNGLNSQTDAVMVDDNFSGQPCAGDSRQWISSIGGSGIIGVAFCISTTGSHPKCQRHDLWFDTQYMGPRSAAAEQALACHEIGHSLGLKHNSLGGCMLDPVQLETHLGHEIPDHLNVHY